MATAERCLTILVEGQSDDFTVRVGIGKWIQNMAVASIKAVLTAGLFLPIDLLEMAWNSRIQHDIMDDISRLAEDRPRARKPA